MPTMTANTSATLEPTTASTMAGAARITNATIEAMPTSTEYPTSRQNAGRTRRHSTASPDFSDREACATSATTIPCAMTVTAISSAARTSELRMTIAVPPAMSSLNSGENSGTVAARENAAKVMSPSAVM